MSGLSPADLKAVTAQLGKEPRGRVRVVSRCSRGFPTVIETMPDGEFFTASIHWLTCPWLRRAVGRLESGPEFAEARRLIAGEEVAGHGAASARHEATLRHAMQEAGDRRIRGRGIDGGGNPAGLKCLHAHLAHYLATGEGPAGRFALESIGEAECPDGRCRDDSP